MEPTSALYAVSLNLGQYQRDRELFLATLKGNEPLKEYVTHGSSNDDHWIQNQIKSITNTDNADGGNDNEIVKKIQGLIVRASESNKYFSDYLKKKNFLKAPVVEEKNEAAEILQPAPIKKNRLRIINNSLDETIRHSLNDKMIRTFIARQHCKENRDDFYLSLHLNSHEPRFSLQVIQNLYEKTCYKKLFLRGIKAAWLVDELQNFKIEGSNKTLNLLKNGSLNSSEGINLNKFDHNFRYKKCLLANQLVLECIFKAIHKKIALFFKNGADIETCLKSYPEIKALFAEEIAENSRETAEKNGVDTLVDELSPDIFFLQEVNNEERAFISKLEESYQLFHFQGGMGAPFDTAIALKKERFDVVNADNKSSAVTIELQCEKKPGQQKKFTKDVAICQAEDRLTNKKIIFASLHIYGFDFNLRGKLLDKSLERGNLLCRSIVKRLSDLKEENNPLIIGADMNADVHNGLSRFKIFQDSEYLIGATGAVTNINGSERRPHREIDYFFFTRNVFLNAFPYGKDPQENSKKKYSLAFSGIKDIFSDHIPICARFEIVENASSSSSPARNPLSVKSVIN